MLGFLDNSFAFDRLNQLALEQPNTWRKRLVKLSLERWQKNSWARYWFDKFLNEKDRVIAWSSFRLFLKCVDERFWLWRDNPIDRASSQDRELQKSYLSFLEDNTDTINNSIKNNEQKLTQHLFGHKIVERQAWPWI
jgi:hypothetical protein